MIDDMTEDMLFECWMKAQRDGRATFIVSESKRRKRVMSSADFAKIAYKVRWKSGLKIDWIEWPEGWRYAPSR